MKQKITSSFYYLQHFVRARHRKGHGIHSPFVYDFVSRILFDDLCYPEYDRLNRIRSELRSSTELLSIEEMGAPSMVFRKGLRNVAQLARHSSVTPKYGKLLFRIAKHYKPLRIVELGTSIGLSTCYLALGNRTGTINTIEGNGALCRFAEGLFQREQIANVNIRNGNFDTVLPLLLRKDLLPDLVYIDGNHSYIPTLNYFKQIVEVMPQGVIVIDDIRWSSAMMKAWKEIVADARSAATLELFRMGIVFPNPSLTPGHYCIRF